MTRFRPCIDLHSGQVKQIVGGTLSSKSSDLQTNHVSHLPASHFAALYRAHDVTGAHVIMLGPDNEKAAEEALAAWPGALQVGGGINPANAKQWIDKGASKVSRPAQSHPKPSSKRATLLRSSGRSLSRLTFSQTQDSPRSDSKRCCRLLLGTRRNSSLT